MNIKSKFSWLVIPMISAIIFMILNSYGNTLKIADSKNSNFKMNSQAKIKSILPPNIVFNYNNTYYNGKLINY
jgi:hypothetical protein